MFHPDLNIEPLPVGTAIYRGEELAFEFANDAMLMYWGISRDEALTKHLRELIPVSSETGFNKLIEHVFDAGMPYSIDPVPIKALNRVGIVHVRYDIQAYKDKSGKVISTIITASDITAQLDVQQRVAGSEGYFQKLIDSVPSTIWTTDKSGYCTFLSRQWHEYTGQSKEEALGLGWLDATHPDDKEAAGKIFLQANERREKFSLSYRLKTKSQSYRWCRDSGSPRFDDAGNFIGFIGSVIDIHDEKTANDKVQKTESDLTDVLEKLRLATESASVGIWSLDEKTASLNWSPLHKRLWGYDEGRTDLSYHDWYKVILPEDRDIALSRVEDAKTQRTQYESLYRIRRDGDGAIRWIRSAGKYQYNDAGEPLTLTGISIDVTEQKTAEERFRTLAETLPQLVWMTDGTGAFDFASRKWEEYTGIDPTSEGAWDKVVHPDDKNRVAEYWTSSLKSGKAYQVEARLKSRHGEYRWYFAKAEPVLNQAGDITRWIGAYSDVHEQKMLTSNLEKAVHSRTSELEELNGILQKKNIDLEDTQNFLQQLIDSSIEFICVLDSELKVLTVNKKFEETQGVSKDFIIGKHLFELTPGARGSEQHDSILRCLKGETVHLSKLSSIGISGFIVDSYFVPLKLQGEVRGVIIMSRDVTEIVRSAQLLEEKNYLLERSNQDLQQFAHVASHDLKEPLRKIQIFADRLESEPATSISVKGSEYLQKITNAAKRMSAMIEGILGYSSADAHTELRDIVNLNDIIDTIRIDLEVVISARQAVIQSENLPTIEGSEILFFQLFYNLINNSLKFSRTEIDPVIEITYVPNTNNSVEIIVKDNGIGFEKEFTEKIFETFARLNGKDTYEGTGLGLALCRKIVERHRGKIWATSELGEGAQFHIVLPTSQRTDV